MNESKFGEWQPIGTAPQTGQTILLGYFNEFEHWLTMRGQWMYVEDMVEWWGGSGQEPRDGWYSSHCKEGDLLTMRRIDPTHWMPLAKPPSRKEEQA